MAGLWKKIRRAALTDVGVLIKGVPTEALESIEQTLAEADFGPSAIDMVEALEVEVRAGRMKSENALQDWLTERIASMAGEQADGELQVRNTEGPAVENGRAHV